VISAARCFALFALALLASAAQAKTICTAIADAKTGAILLQEGNCGERVTPASTFKLPLSVMAFDAGFLKDEHTPALPFQKGDADWGGDNWRQPTDPARWLKYSVVWYSQRIAHSLGEARLHRYATGFGYGNADFSGDPGKDNGLDRSWIGSSLKISPLEQLAFLRKLVRRELPASPHAIDMTLKIVESTPVPGWEVHGKTGSAWPKRENGEGDESRSWGWYVGWASKGDRTLVFARLTQDDKLQDRPAGVRTREAFVAELPALAGRLAQPR
jgi:beta-lactamase class D